MLWKYLPPIKIHKKGKELHNPFHSKIGKPHRPLLSATSAAIALLLSLTLTACGSGDDSPVAAMEPQAASLATASVEERQFDQFNVQALPEAADTDRFIVKYKENSRQRRDATSIDARVNERTRSMRTHARHSHRLATGADVIVTDRKLTREEAKAYMQQVYADPEVEYIEPDVAMYADMTPNDPQYYAQGAYLKPQGRYLGGINAEEAWDIANGSGVVIAELDSGIAHHADLDDNVLPGIDIRLGRFTGDGRDPGASCADWHGTHVAGTLAASTNNGLGVAGTAWGAKIVPVRVLSSCGLGFGSDVASGIIWASGGVAPGAPINPHPAQVLNLSLGGAGTCSRTMQDAIDDATSRGAIVVVAAGNSTEDTALHQPANCNHVITVASSSPYGAASSFSNFGDKVDISAPGESIYSTLKRGTDSSAIDSYGQLSGTSMAAPHVAGVVALMQSVAKTPLTTSAVKTILAQTARAFLTTPPYPMGAGILDAKAAVMAVCNDCTAKPPVVVTPPEPLVTAADFIVTEWTRTNSFVFQNTSTAKSGTKLVSVIYDFDDGRGPHDYTVLPPGFKLIYNFNDGTRIYNVKLTVTDSDGGIDTIVKPVSVIED
ncbi:S8 family serine peptidase [Ralstonia sp. 24A2]|uniref:S8 family serine peptidase n=1 Tax=Ralstonia sp. 24A2 TaxID=3447364 RepID=UPI003F6A08FD